MSDKQNLSYQAGQATGQTKVNSCSQKSLIVWYTYLWETSIYVNSIVFFSLYGVVKFILDLAKCILWTCSNVSTQEKASGLMDKAKDAAASAQDSMQHVSFLNLSFIL